MEDIFCYTSPQTASSGSGPLRGLKTAIQPCFCVAEWPTDAGSRALAGFTALEDATVVERLRQAGAVLTGLTRMSEFGFGLDDNRAGMAIRNQAADVELSLDLMGETRLAAARASVCGFKPSWGIVSRFGLIGLMPSMECCGLLSGGVKPIREVLKVIAGPDERDYSLPDEKTPDFSPGEINPRETTIGVVPEGLSNMTSEQRDAFEAALAELREAGFSPREISLPDFSLFALVHRIVGSVEASSSAGRYDSVRYGQRAKGAKNWNEMYLLSRGAAFGTLVKSYLFQGAFFQFERYDAYEDACRVRARLLAAMAEISAQADFLALPAVNPGVPDMAASLDDTYRQFFYTTFANITGQPALYLPPGAGAITPGLQLAGPRLGDARLLALGEYLLSARQGGK